MKVIATMLFGLCVAACSTPQPPSADAASDVRCEVGFSTGSAIAVKRCLSAEQAEEQRRATEQVKGRIQDTAKVAPARDGAK